MKSLFVREPQLRHAQELRAHGFSLRQFWVRAWRLLMGRLSTWRCQRYSGAYKQQSLMFNGSSSPTRFCSPHYCSWEDHWEITTAGVARAIGTWSGFTAITTAIGPVLGGWLIEHVSWRAVFFINLPLAAIVLLISVSQVPESRDQKQKKQLDWLGAMLTTIGLGSIIYGLIESSRLHFGHPVVLTALVTGSFFLIVFLIVEARVKNPMLPLALFRSRDFTGANLLTLFLYSALGGALFFLPLNLIQVQGYTATAAGAALLPFILIMFFLSRWSGGLVERYGSRLPLVFGPIIAAVGFVLFTVPGIGAHYWSKFFPAVAMLGLGMAVSVAPLTTTVMNAVPRNRVGIASGINNAVSRVAGLLAVAVFGIVMVNVFNRSLDLRLSNLDLPASVQSSLANQRINLAAAAIPEELTSPTRDAARRAINESFVQGFRRVMLLGAALALASGITSLLLITGRAKAVQSPHT